MALSPCSASLVAHPRQHVTRVAKEGLAVAIVHGQQNLGRRAIHPRHQVQRSGHRPADTVLVARLDMHAGFLDLAAPDIEAEEGERQRHAVFEDLPKGTSGKPLATQHAIAVGQDDLERVEVAVTLLEASHLLLPVFATGRPAPGRAPGCAT